MVQTDGQEGVEASTEQLAHSKFLCANIQGITMPAIRRLARRGGQGIFDLGYRETRGVSSG